jgi:hypothetical protein
MGRLRQFLADSSLNAKVTVTLVAAFVSIVGAFLLFMVPFMAEQRASLLEKDKRLLSTLRDNHERDFIYDLLSENEESLGIHLADLAGQRGLVWARVESEGVDLAATADPGAIRQLLGEEARPFEGLPSVVLLVRPNGDAHLLGAGGRPLIERASVSSKALPEWKKPKTEPWFEDLSWNGQTALYFGSRLAAAGEPFGLHLPTLADVRGARPHHTLFYGLAGTSFVLLLILLNPHFAHRHRPLSATCRRCLARPPATSALLRTPETSSGPRPTPSTAWWGDLSKREVEEYCATSRPWWPRAPGPSRSPRPTFST